MMFTAPVSARIPALNCSPSTGFCSMRTLYSYGNPRLSSAGDRLSHGGRDRGADLPPARTRLGARLLDRRRGNRYVSFATDLRSSNRDAVLGVRRGAAALPHRP